MKTLGIAAVVFLAFCGFALLIFHIKSHRPLRSLLLNALLAIAAIIAVNLTRKFTGVHIPLNWWTVGGSSIFGIPAVCGVIILQIILT